MRQLRTVISRCYRRRGARAGGVWRTRSAPLVTGAPRLPPGRQIGKLGRRGRAGNGECGNGAGSCERKCEPAGREWSALVDKLTKRKEGVTVTDIGFWFVILGRDATSDEMPMLLDAVSPMCLSEYASRRSFFFLVSFLQQLKAA